MMKPFGEQTSSQSNRSMARAREGVAAARAPERDSASQRASGRHEQVRAIFDGSLDAMVVFDDNWRILNANAAACEFFGVPLDDMRSRTFDSLFAPAEGERFRSDWREVLRNGRRRGEREIELSDGRVRIAEFSSTANFLPGRHLSCLRDITEHRRAEDSLHQLSQRLLTMQDDERRRIARELHDSTGQSLAATILNLEFVSRDEAALGPRARKALHDAIAHATTCAGEVRTISYLLHPPMLDDAGLAAALQWYVAGFGERSGIAVQLNIPRELDRLEPDLRTALFRIVQEALSNIHRHAESPTAKIVVVLESKGLVLQVSDEGRGMPAEILSDPGGIGGLGVGLAGMRERVRQLGGELEIKSGDSGTTVIAKFPLEVSDGDPAFAGGGRS